MKEAPATMEPTGPTGPRYYTPEPQPQRTYRIMTDLDVRAKALELAVQVAISDREVAVLLLADVFAHYICTGQYDGKEKPPMNAKERAVLAEQAAIEKGFTGLSARAYHLGFYHKLGEEYRNPYRDGTAGHDFYELGQKDASGRV